ncbi:clathrin light chain, partial [Haematococcus lacustris]
MELTSDAFIGGYTPAPAPAAQPVEEDARIAWRRKNQEVLRAKDEAEATAKKEAQEKAAAKLKSLAEVQCLTPPYPARQKTLEDRQAKNRAAQKVSPDAGVPSSGSCWEKVHSLITGQKGPHSKDVTKLKETLEALKADKK